MKRVLSLLLVFVLTASIINFHSTSSAATTKLSRTKLSLYEGGTYKLSMKGTSKKVSWSSSKTKIATVSSSGTVKAKKAGSASITARVGGKKYTCKLTVYPNENEGTKAAPLSAYDKYSFTYYEEGKKRGKFTIQLLSFVSGDDAAAMAVNNSTNPVPDETQEYLYFKFEIKYVSGEQAVEARDLFDYNHNVFGEDSTVEMTNIDWGFYFEPIDDLGTTTLLPGNKIVCSKAILVEKGFGPITYRIQTGNNSYTWFTTKM